MIVKKVYDDAVRMMGLGEAAEFESDDKLLADIFLNADLIAILFR